MGESMDKLKPNKDINLVSTNMHNIKINRLGRYILKCIKALMRTSTFQKRG
jgi:hypothetical protein